MRVADTEGTIVYADQPDARGRPEISRHALTQLLLSELPAAAIRWEHKLFRATVEASNTNEIHLDFGPTHGTKTADLVVGADGAWSHVRALLTRNKPHYSGLQHITLTMVRFGTRHPHLAALVGPGSFMALGGHKGVTTQQGARDSVRMYIQVSTPDEDFAARMGLAGLTPLQARDRLLGDDQLFGKWGGPMRELIAHACEEDMENKLDIKGLYTLPVGKLAWEHRPGVTLGVNLAMWDALELAEVVGRAYKEAVEKKGEGVEGFRQALQPLMRDFEQAMAARSEEKMEESVNLQQLMFGHDDGAQKMAAMFNAPGGPAGSDS
ncbi:hypothetical protein B0H10DRAFT_2054706 [Mycena sp. CBHHK59/15]|nr:hypothetical protein B0H10DRAFT_2054706 [Mycena sp. CBHHK59/15]